MIKVGDLVRKKNGENFSNGKSELTVERLDQYFGGGKKIAWFKETETNLGLDDIEVVRK